MLTNRILRLPSNRRYLLPQQNLKFFRFFGDGALANCEEKGHSTSFFTGPVVYIVTDGQNLFYDDQVIEVPKGKKAMQIGTFRYETKLGEKVVPVIKFQ